MRKFRLSDRDKIELLKAALLASIGSSVAIALAYKNLEKQFNHLAKITRLSSRMISRFADLSEPGVWEQIRDEFEFEFITMGLEDPEFKEKKK